IGFQFSFLVTFALLLTTEVLKSLKSRFYQALYISFISQMIILPLQLDYFYQFQPLSIIVNIFVIPYYSLFVIPYMLILLVSLVFPIKLTQLLDIGFSFVNEVFLYYLKLVDLYLDFPLLAGELSATYFILYYLLLLLFMTFLEQKKHLYSFYTGLVMV